MLNICIERLFLRYNFAVMTLRRQYHENLCLLTVYIYSNLVRIRLLWNNIHQVIERTEFYNYDFITTISSYEIKCQS